jgi:DNA polymerase epsilon subunit 2
VLPVLLPPATLRPLAFRTITKKHSLTLTTSALQALATFIGRYCGAGWREAGLAEPVLDEIARSWKKAGGGVIVDGGDGKGGALLGSILKTVAGCMAGGRLLQGRRGAPSRQASGSLVVPHGDHGTKQAADRPGMGREDSLGLSGLALGGAAYDANGIDDEDDGNPELHPRAWLKVVGAFEQPRITYNTAKQHFERLVLFLRLQSRPLIIQALCSKGNSH